MIEAVNSAVANATLVRGNIDKTILAEQESTQISRANNTGSLEAPPRAPFISPVISVDLNYDQAVLQIRDSETGDVLSQFPSERVLQNRISDVPAQNSFESTITFEDNSGDISTPQTTPQNDVPVESRLSNAAEIQVSTGGSGQGANTGTGVAQAQIAASALANGAASGQPSAPSNISVTA